MVYSERVLVHGPSLQNLTDFLYFDKIVYPTTKALVRPRDLPPGYVGYPLPEPLSQNTRDKLQGADLTLVPSTLLFKSSAEQLLSQLLQGQETFAQWTQQSGTELGAKLGEIAFSYLETPATAEEVAEWLREIDSKTRKLADYAIACGNRAVAKYYIDDVSMTLKSGTKSVLSVFFIQFPKIDADRINIDDLIEFLTDEETKVKRQLLFDWQNGIEAEVEKGDLRLEDVPNYFAKQLNEYTTWIKNSGLSSEFEIAEFLFSLDESFVEKLTNVAIPQSLKSIFLLGKRKLNLIQEEFQAPGGELAYIAHSKRGFGP